MSTPSNPSGDDAEVTSEQRRDSDTPPKAPRWVKVSMIIAAVLILLVVLVKLTGLGGEHGPGRHSGAGLPSVSATAMASR